MADRLNFEDGDTLKVWLKDEPATWAQAIAARCALRVFPLVFSLVDHPSGPDFLDLKQELILNVWRATFISWVCRMYPKYDLKAAAAAAASVTNAANAFTKAASKKTTSQTFPALSKAVSATSSEAAAFYACSAASYESRATTASAASNAAAAASQAALGDRYFVWSAVNADVQFLQAGNVSESPVPRLVSMPLWIEPIPESERYKTNSPEFTRLAFDRFANLDWVRNSPWELITDWYVAVLPNDKTAKPSSRFGERADIVIATQPDEFWDREPQIVLDAIAEIVAREMPEQPVDNWDHSRFSIIRTAKDGYWGRGTIFSFDARRFLEHTNAFYTEEFSPLDDRVQANLLNIPTLFTYEQVASAQSRIGHISAITKNGNTLDFTVAFDEEAGWIDTEKLERVKVELGIDTNFELHRTHWSIKEGDLYQILHDASLISDAHQPTIADFIVNYIEAAYEPVTIDQIRSAFRDANYPVIDKTMRGELSRLAKIGGIRRVDRGLYANKSWVAPSVNQPPTPESGPGPKYGVVDGRLAALASPPPDDETTAQERLIARLKRDIGVLNELAKPIGNSHPHLAGAIAEYGELLSASIEEMDVTGLWSVGSSLAGYAQAFRDQNIARTLSEPLEPQLDGLLQSVVRQHGAFILGFEEGRDLVSRADEFALDRNRLAEIEQPGNELLEELTENAALVDDATRDLHAPVRDYLHDVGWMANRAGYSGYLIIRNSIRAVIHLTIGKEPTVAAIVGALAGVSVMAGDPNMNFLRAALPFLRENAPQLIAFFNHSPEMKAYVEWALRIVGEVEMAERYESDD
ncbi:hypothetical protein DFR52_106203 [Hoeflea marina]|uniref:Uncharacterized protein n=1 Tax=Hoeflea marina TaxID=274592 RepID=A0A317PDR2_9HYPH|nr:hypothetical protein [Hoeflea marina]PWV97679.1 hypothetical protein DFR52_106203 [Hoeflea marina]